MNDSQTPANPVQGSENGTTPPASGDFLSSIMGMLGGGGSGASSGGDTPPISGKGGSDPISAIAGAVGSIFTFANTAQSGKNNRDSAIAESRSFKTWFSTTNLGTPTMAQSNKVPIIILGSIFLLVTVFVIVKMPKTS